MSKTVQLSEIDREKCQRTHEAFEKLQSLLEAFNDAGLCVKITPKVHDTEGTDYRIEIHKAASMEETK